MAPTAAQAEIALSQRIRATWRLAAVDLDLEAALGRKVLIAGKDLRNFGMELKPVEAGPLNLSDRQYDVLRRTRSDTPPFVFQFTSDPWCFRVWPLREDSLEALARRPYVTLSEREAEAFTFALIMGATYPFAVTEVEPQRFTLDGRSNLYAGSCIECGGFIAEGAGQLARSANGAGPWVVIHATCAGTLPIPTVSIRLNDDITSEYLHAYSSEIVPENLWPDVKPPRDYTEPPLNPPNTLQAARVLRLLGVFDREDAAEALTRRPELRVVPQKADAVAIVERVMADIAARRGEPAPTPDAVEARIQEFERHAATRIFRSAYVDQAALAQRERAFARVVGSGRSGPFVGSDRGAGGHDAGRHPMFWDWSDILARDAAARAQLQAMPRCRVCGEPMVVGQPETHYVCVDPAVVGA